MKYVKRVLRIVILGPFLTFGFALCWLLDDKSTSRYLRRILWYGEDK